MTDEPKHEVAGQAAGPWPREIEMRPVRRVGGSVRPPGSKSLSNRAIVVAALADGRSTLAGALDSEDTQVMIDSWRRLGVAVEHDRTRSIVEVAGCDGRIPASSAELFLANSGTSMRFLTAAVSLGSGVYRLDGVERMRQRPIEGLLTALRSLGADATSELGTGCPPVRVRAAGLRGGTCRVAGDESSQFCSALLMAAPLAAADVHVEVTGELVSAPFVRMTTQVMQEFGVAVSQPSPQEYLVRAGQRYRARPYSIEPDATAASYFWAAAAIAGGEVTVEGLGTASVQGDMAFLDHLERMGAKIARGRDATTVSGRSLCGIDADMRDISDTAITLAVVAACAEGPTRIRGIAHARAQETDRVQAMATELRKLGCSVEEHADGVTVQPGPLRAARIETYNDHRMAMSFALLGLRTPGIVITNPACTAKTYPQFFDDLARIATS